MDRSVLADAQSRLKVWREAAALGSAPSATDTVARLRQHLADDLDTPKALDATRRLGPPRHRGRRIRHAGTRRVRRCRRRPTGYFASLKPLLCAFINRPRLIKAHSSF